MNDKAMLLFLSVVMALGSGKTLAQDDDSDDVTRIDVTDAPPPAEEACFNVRAVRSFDAITDMYIYVRARRDEHYLLTMFSGCFGLRGALGIGISNVFSRVCSNDNATIVYRDFGRRETCRIRRVESVSSKEAAEELVELRTTRD